MNIGAMLGAIISGTVADRAGRRWVSVNPVSILLIELSWSRAARWILTDQDVLT
jgi:MFS family permease